MASIFSILISISKQMKRAFFHSLLLLLITYFGFDTHSKKIFLIVGDSFLLLHTLCIGSISGKKLWLLIIPGMDSIYWNWSARKLKNGFGDGVGHLIQLNGALGLCIATLDSKLYGNRDKVNGKGPLHH